MFKKFRPPRLLGWQISFPFSVECAWHLFPQRWWWVMCVCRCSMASTVMQIYLKPVLESYFHVEPRVRLCAAQVAIIVLRQGLVHVAMVSRYEHVFTHIQGVLQNECSSVSSLSITIRNVETKNFIEVLSILCSFYLWILNLPIFTVLRYASRGIAMISCPSVTLVNCDHTRWNSAKIISRVISLGSWLLGDPNITDLLQREHP